MVACQRLARSYLARRRLETLIREFAKSSTSLELRRRNLALREVIGTETDYCKHLNVTVSLFEAGLTEEALKDRALLTRDDVSTVFSNIQQIAELNVQLLAALQARMRLWPESTKFGDIFTSFAPLMSVYSRYLRNYERGMARLEQLEGRSAFTRLMEPLYQNQDCKYVSLSFYLIMPVQRLPRYILLLDNLIQLTPPEHAGTIVHARSCLFSDAKTTATCELRPRLCGR